jgi:hypothetical protein
MSNLRGVGKGGWHITRMGRRHYYLLAFVFDERRRDRTVVCVLNGEREPQFSLGHGFGLGSMDR